MAFPQKRLPFFILTLLIVLTLITGIVIYLHPMAIFPDPSWGFQVLRSMEHGAAFNHRVFPDQADISQNSSEFLSWWSPGQYLLPYFFRTLFHTNLGQSSVLTIVFCEIAGLFGFYQFFRKAGFSTTISSISVAFIASQVFYVSPFIFYNGGEVLLFGFAGWFLYGCISFNRVNDWRLLLFILLSGLTGFFCKSSFMWIYAAGLVYIWIRVSQREQKPSKWIINGIWLGVPAVIALATIYLGYLSKGETPASSHHKMKLLFETFGFPLASPLLSGFSIDDLTHGLLFHPDGPMFSYPVAVLIVVVLAVLSLWLFAKIRRFVPYGDYRLLLTVFYVTAVLFFSYSYLRQLAISYEGRHLRIIGILFIPGIIYLISRLKISYKVVFGVIWLGMLAASLQFLIHGNEVNIDEGAHGPSGITQQFLDQPSLDTLVKLDNTHRNALFVFISPDLGLEVQHNRFITLEPVAKSLKINYADFQHCGHAGPLYIFLPGDYQGAKADIIMKSFEDYKNFKMMKLTEDYVMYTAP